MARVSAMTLNVSHLLTAIQKFVQMIIVLSVTTQKAQMPIAQLIKDKLGNLNA
jgi:hypothetical protein